MKHTILLIATFLLFSCAEKSEVKFADISEVKSLNIQKEQIKLPLDSTTSLFNYLNQSIKLDNSFKYLIYSKISNSLIQYNLDEGNIEKYIKFESQGPNSLKGLEHGSGMHYINPDSIIFFSISFQKLFLANLDGQVYSEFSLSNDSIAFGSVDSRSKMEYKEGSVYIQSLPIVMNRDKSEFSDRRLTISEYDLSSRELIQHPLSFADIYVNNDFSQRLEVIDFVYSSKMEKFIISLPLDPNIYITDLSNDIKSILTPSNLVQSANQMDLKNKEIPTNSITSYYYWTSDSFGKLFYDMEKDYIYRIARSAISHEQFLSGDFYANQEVIVLNDKREVVGSIPHSGTSFIYHFFNDKSVFWNSNFKTMNMQKNNEDTLYFENHEIY